MCLIDLLRTLSMSSEIMLDNFKEKTQVMKVKNLTWGRIRKFAYKQIIRVVPCERNGKPFLYIAVDGGLYDGRNVHCKFIG